MKTLLSFLFVVLIVSILASNSARADIRLFELHRQKVLAEKEEANQVLFKLFGATDEDPTKKGSVKFTFEQKLNHDDANDARTFTQRYWVNSDNAIDKSSPVLLYICGESVCRTNGSMLTHAKELNAHVVYVEHRYYGQSVPTKNLTAENLKYLSTAAALADLKAIQTHLQKELTGKWVVVGGSYAGSLAAYYRLKHPELVVGALASSGPVMAKENFEEYDLHVSKVAGPECGAKIKEAVAKAEALLDKPTELQALKKKFQAEALTDDVDFMYLIADMGALAVQYGYKDRFCELLTNNEPLKGYADFTREIFMLWGMKATDMSAQGALTVEMESEESNMRQWFYQSCTEYGYWQNAYHDPVVSVRSSLINAEYHRNICIRLFGLDTLGNEKYINETYYQPLLTEAASNIFYTNGSQDPWLNLSVAPENKNDTNPNTPTFTMEGAAHCDDLSHGTLPDVKAGRAKFVEFAKNWLAN